MTVAKDDSGPSTNILNPSYRLHFDKLQPLVKWAGGKEKELKYIIPNLPKWFEDYYEPFVGGGAVYTTIRANRYFINDKSTELISLYRSIISKDKEAFFAALEDIIISWNLLTLFTEENSFFLRLTYRSYAQDLVQKADLERKINTFVLQNTPLFYKKLPSIFHINMPNFMIEVKANLIRKINRMKELERKKHALSDIHISQNIEGAIKSAFYMHLRYLYNHQQKYQLKDHLRAALFLFIRNFAYSGMFRYNANGNFNVPYGGIAYNRKRFQKKINYLRTDALKALLEKTTIENLDFEAFLTQHKPRKNDFIFLDPPYDSEFSTYSQNEFTKKDQIRLARYLTQHCEAQWMMIIKNTDFIYNLYQNKGLFIKSFGKKYLVSFMNRNKKNTEHLLITNYQNS